MRCVMCWLVHVLNKTSAILTSGGFFCCCQGYTIQKKRDYIIYHKREIWKKQQQGFRDCKVIYQKMNRNYGLLQANI